MEVVTAFAAFIVILVAGFLISLVIFSKRPEPQTVYASLIHKGLRISAQLHIAELRKLKYTCIRWVDPNKPNEPPIWLNLDEYEAVILADHYTDQETAEMQPTK